MFSTNQRVKRLQAVIEKDGFNQQAHFLLGEQYLEDGRPMQAANKFRRVVELNPDHARAWRYMGDAFKAAGVYKEAAVAYDTAAYAYRKKGMEDQAVEMTNAAEETTNLAYANRS